MLLAATDGDQREKSGAHQPECCRFRRRSDRRRIGFEVEVPVGVRGGHADVVDGHVDRAAVAGTVSERDAVHDSRRRKAGRDPVAQGRELQRSTGRRRAVVLGVVATAD